MKTFDIIVLKKNRCIIIRELNLNGANNWIDLSYLPVGLSTSLYEFIFTKIIKIPRAESCDMTIAQWIIYIGEAGLGIFPVILNFAWFILSMIVSKTLTKQILGFKICAAVQSFVFSTATKYSHTTFVQT